MNVKGLWAGSIIIILTTAAQVILTKSLGFKGGIAIPISAAVIGSLVLWVKRGHSNNIVSTALKTAVIGDVVVVILSISLVNGFVT